MIAAPAARLSVEEYLALDRDAEVNCEYHDGEIFPIEDATFVHGRIGANAARRLGERLDGSPFLVANPVRICVGPTRFVYPDLVVICGKPALMDARRETLMDAKVIVEILSPTTDGYNYGRKFSLYRLLPSFEEYVLIAQDEVRVDVFRKTPDNTWVFNRYSGRESVARLESLGIELPLVQLYAGVDDSEFSPS